MCVTRSWDQGPDKVLEAGLLDSWATGSLVPGQDRAAWLRLAANTQKGQEYTALFPQERNGWTLYILICCHPCSHEVQEPHQGPGEGPVGRWHLGSGISSVSFPPMPDTEFPWDCLTLTRAEQLPLGAAVASGAPGLNSLSLKQGLGCSHYKSVNTDSLWCPEQPHPKVSPPQSSFLLDQDLPVWGPDTGTYQGRGAVLPVVAGYQGQGALEPGEAAPKALRKHLQAGLQACRLLWKMSRTR